MQTNIHETGMKKNFAICCTSNKYWEKGLNVLAYNKEDQFLGEN